MKGYLALSLTWAKFDNIEIVSNASIVLNNADTCSSRESSYDLYI